MCKMLKLFGWVVPLLIAAALDAATGLEKLEEFRVRRRNQNQENRELFTGELFWTYSDDGRSKTLDTFFLVMFETPNALKQPDALPVLRMAMNRFLLAEFNEIYAEQGNTIESIGSEVLWDARATDDLGRRSLQRKVGREAEMEVTLTFENEPSPPRVDLEEKIREVMADLTHFVGNLTSFQNEDWKDVTEAYRREKPTAAPSVSPDDTDGLQISDGGEKERSATKEKNNNGIAAIIPTTLIAASFVALVVFLLVQRRRRSTTDASTKGGTTMFVGGENDIYSIDRSLGSGKSPSQSPHYSGSISYSLSADDSDQRNSVFSGLDYQGAYSVDDKIVLPVASVTNASVATTRASNRDPSSQLTNRQSPGRNSMYDYSEEAEEASYDENTSSTYNGTSKLGRIASSDVYKEEASRVDLIKLSSMQKDDPIPEQPRQKLLFACSSTGPSKSEARATSSSSDVLADLENLENKRASSRNASPSAVPRTKSGSLYANLFSCNPNVAMTVEEAQMEARDKITPRNAAISGCNPSLNGSDYKTPLTRNAAAPVMSTEKGSNSAGVMSGKATQMVYDTNGRPIAFDDSALPSSNPKLPMRSGSKSAPSSPERRRYRANLFRSLPAWRSSADDYADSLSQPSTPGDEMERSLKEFQNVGYGGCYYPFRKGAGHTPAPSKENDLGSSHHRRHAGNTPGHDGSAMYQTDAMHPDSAGRRHNPNTGVDGTATYQNDAMNDPRSSRRHVENTDIDGTAMYQESAMNPLEWSYNPTDNHSIGESTLSEQDGEAMPRQFLFGGRLSRSNKSTKSALGNEPKTPMSHHTFDSSQASASKQLVSDLVWLEQKIADVRQVSSSDPPAINNVDSLSYVSDHDQRLSISSSRDDSEFRGEKNESVMSSIVCRDCYAPPGKLHIVIHSTKDGPAVHTVKSGSSLEGHIFPGDLIISVDNIDTRSYTAEQVMKMMASKSDKERKITVLHFEEED